MVLLVLSVLILALTAQEIDGRILSSDPKSKFNNNGVITTIQTDHGDVFDCVDIHNQPSFGHPKLKDHTLQMRPSFLTSVDVDETKSERKLLPFELQNGGCPKGTVPILKVHLIARNSTDERRKVYPSNVQEQETSNPTTDQVAFYSTNGGKYYGASAMLNLWSPYVASDQFTEVKIILLNGDPDFNSIEAGWTVNPNIFGDINPRLFGRNTATLKNQENQVDGFVQVSQTIALGARFTTVSVYGGQQVAIGLLIMKDNISGNWWLAIGPDRIMIGYWPKELFAGLDDHATQILWGGEASKGAAMGNGHEPEDGFGKAAFIGQMKFVDEGNVLIGVDERRLYKVLNDQDCYRVLPSYDEVLKLFGMYFGGPGGQSCS